VAFEQRATVLRQCRCPFAFVEGNSLDESLSLERSKIVAGFARIPQIALRDHPKRTDGGECSRVRPVERVIAVAIVHELAVWTAGQLEVADEHVSRIECAIIVSIACVMVTLARSAVAAVQVFIGILGQHAAATSERQALFLAIVNAVVSLARINIARIEIASIRTSQHR
jgi:hypothetical protein